MSTCLVCEKSDGLILTTGTNWCVDSETGQVGVCDECLSRISGHVEELARKDAEITQLRAVLTQCWGVFKGSADLHLKYQRMVEAEAFRELAELCVDALEPPALVPDSVRHCCVCGRVQVNTSSGWVCSEGHGGVPSKEEPE